MKKILLILALSVNLLSAEYLYTHNPNTGFNFGDALSEGAILGLNNISCGGGYCVAIKNGNVWSVGRNYYGQIGRSDVCSGSGSCIADTWGDTGFQASKVSAGNSFTLALKSNGEVWTVGQNNYGQLGRTGVCTGSTGCKDVNWGKTTITGTDISAGNSHSMVISGGEVWTSGYNSHGQLGRSGVCVGIGSCYTTSWGNTNKSADFVLANSFSSYAIDNGDLLSSGLNNLGQLGRAGYSNQSSLASTNKTVSGIATNGATLYAIINGNIWSIGGNEYGQLGVTSVCSGSFNCKTANWLDTGVSSSKIFANSINAYAIKSNGDMYTVGHNSYGQLGRSDICVGSSCIATTFGNSNFQVSSVSGSGGSVYILLNDGKIMVVGRNDNGQLGMGDNSTRTTYEELESL